MCPAKSHGMSNAPEYHVWNAMKQRCLKENAKNYHNYGGRGITICNEWMDFNVFINDLGLRPPGNYELERVDNNGNYCPANCKWATKKEQANNRRTNTILTFMGKSLTISQWEDVVGISQILIANRIAKGWTVERALTEPKRGTNNGSNI